MQFPSNEIEKWMHVLKNLNRENPVLWKNYSRFYERWILQGRVPFLQRMIALTRNVWQPYSRFLVLRILKFHIFVSKTFEK